MWTGNIESGYPSQWALNPSAYQNVPADQVDWASLAQQWIKMKEIVPVGYIPPAPPPPSIKEDIERGEAPMDMSKDEVAPSTITPVGTSKEPDSAPGAGNWNSWNNWQQYSWGWSGAEGGDKSGLPPYTYPQAPPAPTYSANVPTATFDYNHGASVPDNFEQQGYWSSGPVPQAPFVRNKSSEWRGESRGSSSSRRPAAKVEEAESDTTTVIDAAKRKQLPNWIREGLEKMEREKQKKLEHERMLREREEELERRKREEEEALASGIPLKSKFETDSEESDKEPEETTMKVRKSRFDATTSSPLLPKPVSPRAMSPPVPVRRKTREEVMQDVLQQVRYVMTDVLLVVTNDEMQKIAEEVLAELRAKAPATQLRKTPAFTSLTGKLGLGIYDSDSESSAEESYDESPSKKENGVDSDEELRERINRKKQEFVKYEQAVEHLVELQEERERERERDREKEREQLSQEEEREVPEVKAQVEPKLTPTGDRLDVKVDVHRTLVEVKAEPAEPQSFTPERPHKTEKESSPDHSEDSSNDSYSKSDSSSRSSSGSRHRRAKKSSKKKKDKKRKRKRSSSRGSDRKKSSRRKSSHRYEEYRHKRSRSRSRESHHRYRRHSSESSHKRRHRSYSHSPEHYRGKKSSHRSRD